MILYHGSNVIVKDPQIIEGEKSRDFGVAFYLTPVKEHAEKWAIRKVKQEREGKPYVSVFEWNEDINNLKFIDFKDADMEWLDIVVKCRSDIKFKHGYDIVKGKIADDSVGETILYVVTGVMRKQDAIKKLKFQEINSQVAFCSKPSLKTLKYIKHYEVK